MPVSFTVAAHWGDVRALLNDVSGNIFTAAALLPHTQTEMNKLQDFIIASGLPYLRRVNTFTSTAGVENFINRSVAQFVDFKSPVKLLDITDIASRSSTLIYQAKTQQEYTDLKAAASTGCPSAWYYSWGTDSSSIGVSLAPTTGIRIIQVEYYKFLDVDPYTLNSASGGTFIYELVDFRGYLAHKVAAIASALILQDNTRAAALEAAANELGSRLIATMIKQDQAIPARRRGFWSSRKRVVIR